MGMFRVGRWVYLGFEVVLRGWILGFCSIGGRVGTYTLGYGVFFGLYFVGYVYFGLWRRCFCWLGRGL